MFEEFCGGNLEEIGKILTRGRKKETP